MSARRVFGVAVAVLLAVSVVAGASALGVVSAGHGEADADYTVEPMSDRSPGATDVKYGQVVVAQAGVDFETLEEMEAVYEEGSWSGCGADDGEVFGIDRGNTHDGYETDEGLEENTKTFSAGEDVFRIEFYGEDDFGPSTHLEDGDAIVSVAECIDNPDEPGWYQISGSSTGVTEDGEEVTVGGESHYFWICECEDEEEAREELGPPPSEEGSESGAEGSSDEDEAAESGSGTESDDGSSEETPAPEGDGEETDTAGESDDAEESTEEDDSGGSSGEDAGDAETATPEPEPVADGDDEAADETTEEDAADASGESAAGAEKASSPATPEETEDEEENALEDGSSGGAEGTANGESWDSHVVQTPTPGDGAGFGVPAALAALAVAALLARRR